MADNPRRQNIQGTFRDNGRARTVLFIVGGLLLIMVVFGAFSMFRGEKLPQNEQGAVPAPPKIENVPGGSKSGTYNALQEEENRKLEEQAAQNATTNLPTMVGEHADPTAVTPFLPELPSSNPAVIPPPAPVSYEQTPQQPAPVYQQPPISAPPPVAETVRPQVDQEALNNRYQKTEAQLNNYLAAWAAVPVGSQEFSFNGQKSPELTAANGSSSGSPSGSGPTGSGSSGSSYGVSGAASGPSGTGANDTSRSKQASLIRAGTVIPAVLLSALNSDNPGPVLAQITSGPLSGTRLLGQFQATDKALVLTFTTMTKPGLGTFAVNAYAVDDKYSVGMVSDVDNHYFKRYGLLLAGSLLSGYGQAMARANTTVVTGPFGTTTTQGALSNKQVNAAALGKVGTTFSEDLLEQSKTKPTIHLDCNGGCPVGLLFMTDL